jgi:serine/threonine protein kinase
MIKKKLSAGSRYISQFEAQAIESLQRLLSAEDGYIIPVMFIGQQISSYEIDALLLLPDAIFLLDFKNWAGQRIEVEGSNGKVRRLMNGAWESKHNSLPNYEYAARELVGRLKRERWLPARPPIYSIMVFTGIGLASVPQVSFAGGDPRRPQPENRVSACRIEQLPQLIAAFRAASPVKVQLNRPQLANLAEILVRKLKSPAKPHQRRIAGYLLMDEHHIDPFLDCKIYLGEGEPLKEQVWIKEYEQVLASPDQRAQKERLELRHADILYRFPQHRNIVTYRGVHATDFHLYIILERKPGAFLSELLSGKPLGQTTEVDLRRIPFDLAARLRILGGLLNALEYLTHQPDFEQSAYRDLRPDSIYVQFTGSEPIAQLFNFDCTKLPGGVTKWCIR